MNQYLKAEFILEKTDCLHYHNLKSATCNRYHRRSRTACRQAVTGRRTQQPNPGRGSTTHLQESSKLTRKTLFLFLILLLAGPQFSASVSARPTPAAEDGFRLIFVGSLSGYVKLCG